MMLPAQASSVLRGVGEFRGERIEPSGCDLRTKLRCAAVAFQCAAMAAVDMPLSECLARAGESDCVRCF